MQPRTIVSISVLGYLALCGLAGLLWLRTYQAPLGEVLLPLAICAAPCVLAVVLLSTTGRELKSFVGRSALAFGFPPILLLFWVSSQQPMAAGAPQQREAHAASRLAEARLFEGALRVDDARPMHGGLELIRTAVFDDGIELRLMRFAGQVEASTYREFLAQAQAGAPYVLSGRQGTRLGSGAEPNAPIIYLEQHGADLLELRGPSPDSLARRIQRVALPAPVPAAVHAPAPPAASLRGALPAWAWGVGAALVHLLAFVAFVYWAAPLTTRVAAVPSAAPCSAEQLRARLLSLEALGLPLLARQGEQAFEVCVDYCFPEDARRTQRAELRIDAAARKVRVREIGGATGAAPRDAAEASMRGPAERAFDPARPRAQKIFARTLSASIIEPEQLARVELTLQGDRVLTATAADAFDPDRMIHLLCAVVTRSGFVWQPVFSRAQG